MDYVGRLKNNLEVLREFSLSYDMVFLSLFLICYYEEKFVRLIH